MAKRIAYLLVAFQLLASVAAAQQADDLVPPPNLAGLWEDQAASLEVRIVQTGRNLNADYLEERWCSRRNGSGTADHTTQDFFGEIRGNKIIGSMTSCKWGSADAGYVWAPIELTIAANGEFLAGHWFNAVAQRNFSITFKKLDGEAEASCRDPLSWAVAHQDFAPFNRQTPADIAPSCQGCSGGIWQFKDGDLSWRNDITNGRCVYVFEATWACTTTGEVRKTKKHMNVVERVDGLCAVRPPG